MLGAFSAAAPGGQWARKALSEPLRERLWFAGEAVHETLGGRSAEPGRPATAPPRRRLKESREDNAAAAGLACALKPTLKISAKTAVVISAGKADQASQFRVHRDDLNPQPRVPP